MTRTAAAAAAALLLAGATLLLYAPVTAFPFVDWDDDVRLLANPWVRSGLSTQNVATAFVTEWNANWSPLTWISHMLDFSLYGMDAGGHHRTNLWLHSLNALLLFGALRTATGALWRPLAVSALFALHPVNVESVAWVSERKGLLAGAFGLGSLWCHVASLRGGSLGLRRLAVLLLGLGLMAKAVLVTFPVLFLLLDRWPLERLRVAGAAAQDRERRSLWRLAVEKWPYALLVPAVMVLTFLFQTSGGAAKSFESLPLAPRLANAVVAYVRYLGMLVWPRDLAVYYPHPNLPGGEPWSILEVAAAGGVLGLLALLAWRLPHPAPRVGLAWYAISLLPTIGILQVGSQAIADRYLYLPAIGVFIAVVWGVHHVVPARGPWPRRLAAAALALLLLPLALASREQIEVWRRSETLFRHAARVTDANYNMHSSLANTLKDRGQLEEARAEYEKALAIHPEMGQAHYNLASVLLQENRIDEAIEHLQRAAETPYSADRARAALGRVLIRKGDMPAALAHFREEVALHPRSADAEAMLAHLLRLDGDLEEALAHYERAAELAPADEALPREIAEVRQQLAERGRIP